MNFFNIENIIQDLTREAITTCPEYYPIPSDPNEYAKEACDNIEYLACSYWEHRNDDEVKRDRLASVTKQDYVNFALDVFNEYHRKYRSN